YPYLGQPHKLYWVGVVSLSLALGAGGYAYKILPPSVEAVTPSRGTAVEAIYATGTVEPTIQISLSPKSTGRMTELLADEGQTVKKGDILAKFEDDDLAAVIEQIDAQVVLAKKELERKEKLIKRKFIAADAYDKALSDLAVAEAALKEAKAKQNFQILRAPEDATIIKRDGEIGEVITANTPVFYLSCCAQNRISAEVDEEDIVRVKTGQKVLIQSDAFPDDVFEGAVKAITPKGDTDSRSFRVRIELPEKFPLLIGMTTETNIVTKESKDALLIPLAALGTKNKVQTIENGMVKFKSVTIGAEGKDQAEILSGLDESSKIISPFRNDLIDNQEVRVRAGGQ
ncbi:MAG: efflux RND transporter periplasmic adaptor subunit, partial [Alphaproteobacteria bacterium]|nr:efflux RND transporter periplasmic adaptor subunit [Alphaproteobacteria bacterium]